MFAAVRSAWSRAREKNLLGLFAFEFVVVVLGVLAAQAVQSWVQERERTQHADEERIRLEEGLSAASTLPRFGAPQCHAFASE